MLRHMWELFAYFLRLGRLVAPCSRSISHLCKLIFISYRTNQHECSEWMWFVLYDSMFQKFRVNSFRVWCWFVIQFLWKWRSINCIDLIEPGVIWLVESVGLREMTIWNKASNLKYCRRKWNEFSDWPIAAVAVCFLCLCRQNFVCWFSPLLLFCVGIKTIQTIRSLLKEVNNDLRV